VELRRLNGLSLPLTPVQFASGVKSQHINRLMHLQ